MFGFIFIDPECCQTLFQKYLTFEYLENFESNTLKFLLSLMNVILTFIFLYFIGSRSYVKHFKGNNFKNFYFYFFLQNVVNISFLLLLGFTQLG
jgi:hypothetical protein